MSTGADCYFVEVEPGKWKYELQQYPYGETDSYESYGPFPSFERARRHLNDNHANPGGYGIHPHAQHVHEWTNREGDYRQVGFTVTLDVESLGPEATKEEVIALVKGLAAAHPAWKVKPNTRYDSSYKYVGCEACGQKK